MGVRGTVMTAALVTWAATAAAQIGPPAAAEQERPASTSIRPRSMHTLGASLQIGGGLNRYEFDAGDAPLFQSDRQVLSGSGSAALRYGYTRNRFSVEALGTSSVFHAPEFAREPRLSHRGRLATTVQLARRTTLNASGDAIYQPVNVTSLFPDMFEGGVLPLPTDYGLEVETGHYMTFGAEGGLSHTLTSRSAMEGRARIRRSDANVSGLALSSVHLSGHYRHEVARGLSLRLGYGYGRGEYRGTAETSRIVYSDTIDAGVDFSRTLSFSRETSLSFSTGTAAVSGGRETRWDVVGSATLAHQLGRSWTTALAYNRQMGFVDVLAEPTFSDSIAARINGLLGRRVGFTARAGASFGSIGFSGQTSNGYRALHASAALQTSVTRVLGMQVSYVYYHYRFNSSQLMPVDIGRQLHRQSLQASLTLGVPLLQTARTRNAAR